MIQIVPQLKVLVACEPVDFRKGIDSLACVCRQQFQLDPFLGTLFVFRNRSGTALKFLVYDGQGFWLFQKRFSKGRLQADIPGTVSPVARTQPNDSQIVLASSCRDSRMSR